MKKLHLPKDNRIKRNENSQLIADIKQKIYERVELEFQNEVSALRNENQAFYTEEKQFFESVKDLLKEVTPETKLKVVTQVGVGSKILNEYTGNLEYKIPYNQTYFNFISPEYNEGRPFSIGFSCLQSIEIID